MIPRVDPPAYPLTPQQFDRAVRNGLGRALIHARRFGVRGIERLITDACLRDDRFGGQVTLDRVTYKIELLRCGDLAEMTRPLIEAAHAGTHDDNIELADVLLGCAAHGAPGCREGARAFSYRVFHSKLLNGVASYAELIIEMDGASGLHTILDIVNLPGSASSLQWLPEELADYLARHPEHVSHADARREIDHAGPAARPFLDEFEKKLNRVPTPDDDPAPPPEPEPSVSIEDVRALLEHAATLKSQPQRESTIIREASRAFRRLSSAERDELLAQLGDPRYEHLRLNATWAVYRSRETPALQPWMLDPLGSTDGRAFCRNADVLSRIAHPDVRDAALRLLAPDNGCPFPEDAIRLLEANYRPGDHGLIERIVLAAAGPHRLDTACQSALETAEAHSDPALLPLVLWTYEHTPCAYCRDRAAEILSRADALPDWVAEERPFNAYTLAKNDESED